MEIIQLDDPFTWDVSSVCDDARSARRAWKLDIALLCDKIEHEMIDGRTLLIYEHLCSRQELLECLDIKLARNKADFGEWILDLRSRSTAYREWYRDWKRKQDVELEEQPPGLREVRPIFQPTGNSSNREPELDVHQPLEQGKRALSEDKRPPKRKRLAPVRLTTTPVGSALSALPTEADVDFAVETHVDHWATLEVRRVYPWESSGRGAYLGPGSLSLHDVKSLNGKLSSRLSSYSSGHFATSVPNHLPPGRRLVVARAMKRLFLRNGRREVATSYDLGSSSSDSGDQVLALQDLPDYFDEETQREIDAERLESERQQAASSARCLDQATVVAVLDQCVEDIIEKYTEKKLPKYRQRAYEIWSKARRSGTTVKNILEARRRVKDYDNRILRLRQRIMDETWSKESEVKQQSESLEQSIRDKLEQEWRIETLKSRREPPKPPLVSRTRSDPRAKQIGRPDEEDLNSSDEDEFLLIDDTEKVGENGVVLGSTNGVKTNDADHTASSLKVLPDIYMDLTQDDPPEEPQIPLSGHHREVIDLSTPTEATGAIHTSPSMAKMEHAPTEMQSVVAIQEIGAQSARYWATENDRFRLAACILLNLPHARRGEVFRGFQRPPEQSKALMRRQIDQPIADISEALLDVTRLAAFDMTLVFFSFSKCKAYKESRICNLSKKDREYILRARGFDICREFLINLESQFPPSDSSPEPDDDALLEKEFSEVEMQEDQQPLKAGKGRFKDIVRNKEAFDLRERERQRVDEQDARRKRLRLTLERLDDIPHEKARLIINESKKEHEPFIYIHEDIGRRIKEHQIEGVRFLWDQLMLDADVRQGCLLAHTMGLGKTMQVITLLVSIRESSASSDCSIRDLVPKDLQNSQTLILCPSGLVDNWMDELLLWTPEGCLGDLRKIDSKFSQSERTQVIGQWASTGGVLLMGYTMFTRAVSDEDLASMLLDKPNIVVADEAHNFKNPKTKLHDTCTRFRTKTRLAMTGSPMANHVEEYYSMIDWVAPNFLGPPDEFRETYANPIQQGLWSDSDVGEKRRALKMLRVLKETCAPKMDRKTINSCPDLDLPVKHEFVLALSPTPMQRELYHTCLIGIRNNRGTGRLRQAELFNAVNNLMLICNHPHCIHLKAKTVRESFDGATDSLSEGTITNILKQTMHRDLLDSGLSNKTKLLTVILDESRRLGDKVLVFSQSIPTLDYLSNLMYLQKRRVCRLDGGTAIAKRQAEIKNFNSGDREVYLISTTAGGIGLNIQGANRVVIFDSKWNPVYEQQAVGRAYRIGQTKPVYVYRFIIAGTFEEDLHKKAVFKMQLASRVVDRKNPVSWANRLGELLHEIRPVKRIDTGPLHRKDAVLEKLTAGDVGEDIRYIVSAETFEEEENVVLTAEEEKEARNLVNMNRLRLTDPEQYERLRGVEQRPVDSIQAGALRAPGVTVRPRAQAAVPQVNWTSDRVADATNYAFLHPATPATWNIHAQVSTRKLPEKQCSTTPQALQGPLADWGSRGAVALRPMAGANTYFKQAVDQRGRDVAGAPRPHNGPAPVNGLRSPGRWIPSAPSRRESFEKTLMAALERLQQKNIPGIAGPAAIIARNLGDEIQRVRLSQGLHLAPDDERWSLLEHMLQHDPFVIACVSGRLTAGFLALSGDKEMYDRVAVLNGLSRNGIGDALDVETDAEVRWLLTQGTWE